MSPADHDGFGKLFQSHPPLAPGRPLTARTKIAVPEGRWWGPQHRTVLDRLAHYPKSSGLGRWKVERAAEVFVRATRERPRGHTGHFETSPWRPIDVEDPPWLYVSIPGGLGPFIRDQMHPGRVPLVYLTGLGGWLMPEPFQPVLISLATFREVDAAVVRRPRGTARGSTAGETPPAVRAVLAAFPWLAERSREELDLLQLTWEMGGHRAVLASLVAMGMPTEWWSHLL